MKRFIIAALSVLFLLSSGTAVFAKTTKSSRSTTSSFSSDSGDFEIDGSFAFATGPGDFGSGYGVNFGAGYMLRSIDNNLQGRVDLSYYDFSYTYGYLGYGYDLSYTRIPLTVSARYYFPINDRLKAFVQAGLETSYDSVDYVDGFGNKHTESDVNLGISPGGGIEFYPTSKVSIFAVGRIHMISDSYFSMQFGGAFHF